MYTVYHGSWRDFTTAVGAIVCTEMNTIFGATFVGHRMYNVCTLYVRWRVDGKYLRGNILFASLTRHTLRLWALTRPNAQPTVPGQGKGKCGERRN